MPVDHLTAELDELVQELRLAAGLGGGTVTELSRTLDRVSQELYGYAHQLGLENPLSHELLGLRTRIDSFVLAARALDDAKSGSTRVVALLRRAVDQTVDELVALGGPSGDAHRLGPWPPTGDRCSSNS